MTDEPESEIPGCVVTHRMQPGDYHEFRRRDLQGRLADAMVSVRKSPEPPPWSAPIVSARPSPRRSPQRPAPEPRRDVSRIVYNPAPPEPYRK